MEWTREKTIILIGEYRKRRGLWDMTDPDYRRKELKQKLLEEVSKCLGGGIPTNEIEKKFHTLRTQYHREINRMKRKEPYNSKWFGFKYLQFLSSPKACRLSKGRYKSEITEEGILRTKYVCSPTPPQDNTSGASNNDAEFLTIAAVVTSNNDEEDPREDSGGVQTNRSHELAKLIEETTREVDAEEETKPIKTVATAAALNSHEYGRHTLQHQNVVNGGNTSGNELTAQTEVVHGHHQSQQHNKTQIEVDSEEIETINIHGAGEEFTYETTSPNGSVQHHAIPTFIKIQRRDSTVINPEENTNYYEQHHNQQQQQHAHPHISMPPTAAKRIYYDANGQQHTATILTTSAATTPTPVTQSNTNPGLLGTTVKLHPAKKSSSGIITTTPQQQQQQQQQQLQQIRDEFSTYGEYVANEMRNITHRQILVALKHKINTALFEASMEEFQK